MKQLLAATLVAAASMSAASQQPPPATPSAPGAQPGQQLPRGQMPELGRPTQETDQLPLFDFEMYFTGKWAFEWLVPDSPLGPDGTITGTTTYKPIGDGFFLAQTDAVGPGGKFTVVERIAYHKENKTVVRHVTDSRGFSYMQMAPIGGDLGGFYNMHFVSEAFVFKGRTIRVRDSVRMVSPVNYRVATTISVDGGRFMNFGNPWWRKDVPGVTDRR